MSDADLAYVALGTNMPHGGAAGPELLARAVSALRAAGLPPRLLSSVWLTPPWPPGAVQPDYHNAAAALDPGGRTPGQLFEALRAIETRFGRERRERWGARTLDLDILAMGQLAGDFGAVSLPHKRMHERAFVLAPLAEIAPDWRHPILGRSARELLSALESDQGVRRIGAIPVE